MILNTIKSSWWELLKAGWRVWPIIHIATYTIVPCQDRYEPLPGWLSLRSKSCARNLPSSLPFGSNEHGTRGGEDHDCSFKVLGASVGRVSKMVLQSVPPAQERLESLSLVLSEILEHALLHILSPL